MNIDEKIFNVGKEFAIKLGNVNNHYKKYPDNIYTEELINNLFMEQNRCIDLFVKQIKLAILEEIEKLGYAEIQCVSGETICTTWKVSMNDIRKLLGDKE